MKTIYAKNEAAGTGKSASPFFRKGSKESLRSPASQPFFKPHAIQPKLTIGQPGDKYEQEADAMADKVVQRSGNPETLQTKAISLATPYLQKKCAACEAEEKLQRKEEEPERLKDKIQQKPILESNTPPPPEKELQSKCANCEEKEKLQKQAAPTSEEADTANIESNLSATKGSGSTLPAGTRSQMETAFGADFSGVRIHNNSSAAQMNKNLQARAFTHGSDIYFNQGSYNPVSVQGQKLLAHELTHVVQQGQTNQIKRQPTDTSPDTSVYDKLREHFRNKDLEAARNLIVGMTWKQKNHVLMSEEFMQLATRGANGGADFGDYSITQLMVAFLSNGYQNLYWMLKWMFHEFDEDTNNTENFLLIIRSHFFEEQRAMVRDLMRSSFVQHLGDRSMTDVVKLLGGPLNQKLAWLKAEDVESWEMAREVIIDHLSKQELTKEERDAIYNNVAGNDMRWYFGRKIDVGDYEMVRLVTLLGFELYQKLDWMVYEDTNESLVMHVIGSSTQPEIKDVLTRTALLKSLEQELGEIAYITVSSAMNQAAGLTETAEEPLNISILNTTVGKELSVVRSGEEAGKKLVKIGSFLLEIAMDEMELITANPNVPDENKHWWLYEMQYLAEMLKLFFQFPEDKAPADYQGPEVVSVDTPTVIQASFIQAIRISPPKGGGGFRSGRGGLGPSGGFRPTFKVSPPKIKPPVSPYPTWRTPPRVAPPKPTPTTSPTPTPTTTPTPTAKPWYTPLPPVSPTTPQTEPKPEEGNRWLDRSDWQTETSKRLEALRRQIEDMKAWRHAAPTPETDTETVPEPEQETEQERRRRRQCYRNSIILMLQGNYFVPVATAITPEDLRRPACQLRTETGTTDNDFMFRNIAVARFIVNGRTEYIAAPNPEGNYHSEDEIFRLATARFGANNFMLDALFSERRPCYRCTGNIYLFPRTADFRAYCIINDDYNWRMIRNHYNQGI